MLREAITNVIDNAIKYSPMASSIALAVRADGRDAVIEVAGQGPGIPAEHRDRIFDRFFRVDAARSRDAAAGACVGSGKGESWDDVPEDQGDAAQRDAIRKHVERLLDQLQKR